MNAYDKGDLVRCTGVFTDSSGIAMDPTTVYFKFKNPDGTLTTYTYGVNAELVKDSVGNYHVDLDANDPGIWLYRFYSTGTGQAAGDNQFTVKQTHCDS